MNESIASTINQPLIGLDILRCIKIFSNTTNLLVLFRSMVPKSKDYFAEEQTWPQ